MNSAELKLNIFRLVDGTNDQHQLSMMYQLMSIYLEQEGTDFDTPESVMASIEKSIQQLEQGEGIPHSEVMDHFRKKFSA